MKVSHDMAANVDVIWNIMSACESITIAGYVPLAVNPPVIPHQCTTLCHQIQMKGSDCSIPLFELLNLIGLLINLIPERCNLISS